MILNSTAQIRSFFLLANMVLILSCASLSPAQIFPATYNPNDNWDTRIIPGSNGQFPYGTQSGIVDDNGIVYVASQLIVKGEIVIKVASWDGFSWQMINGYLTDAPGNSIQVYGIDVDVDGNIYVAGAFKQAYDSENAPLVPVLNIAKYDKLTKSWSGIGSGVSAYNITAFKVDINKNIYVGASGIYQAYNANGTNVLANSIIKWDEAGQTWDDMKGGVLAGSGPGVFVEDILTDGTDVYVAGQFMEAKSATGATIGLNCFAKWDGSGWSMPGTFPAGVLPGYGKSVAKDNSGNIFFSSLDPQFILKYDGSVWTDITQPDANAGDLETDSQGMLYHQHISYLISGYAVSRYDGSNWDVIGKVTGYPRVFYGNRTLPGQSVYLGGQFTKISNPLNSKIEYVVDNAYWDGTDWKAITSIINADTIYSVAVNRYENIFLGGNFIDLQANKDAAFIAGIVNNELIALGKGVDSTVYALDAGRENYENIVFMGGEFSQAEDSDGTLYPNANYVVAWDMETKTYMPLGRGVNGKVYDLKFTNDLYFRQDYVLVGGEFTQATNADGSIVNATNFVAFNLQTMRWEEMGNTNGPVKVVYIGDRTLFIGGSFTQLSGPDGQQVSANNIALQTQLQGSKKWWGLDFGFDDEILAINAQKPFSFSEFQYLMLGGRFTEFTDPAGKLFRTAYFAKLYLSYDDLDEDGVFETPHASYSDLYHNELNGAVHHISGRTISDAFLSGEFTEARMPDGSIRNLNHITRIHGVYFGNNIPAFNYSELGDGTNNTVFKHIGLSKCTSMGVLAAGGFSTAGNKAATSLAKWKINRYASAIHIVTGTSQSSGNGTTATITYLSDCYNPYAKKGLKSSDDFLKKGLVNYKYLMDSYSEFDMNFLNLPDFSDTLASFKGLVSIEDTLVYTLVGLKDTSLYAKNPDGINRSMDLLVSGLSTYSNTAGTGVIFVNTVTDAPAISIVSSDNDTLIKGLKYKEEARYFGLEPREYILDFVSAESGSLLYRDTLNFAPVNGKVLMYFIMGFVDPTVNQNGDLINGEMSDFNFYVKVDSSASVTKQDQFISFAAIADKLVQDASFELNALSSLGLDLSFEVLQGNVSISGTAVSIHGAGTVGIRASQAGNDTVNAAQVQDQYFCVNPEKPLLSLFNDSILVSSSSLGIQWYQENVLLASENNDSLYITESGMYSVSTTIDGCSAKSDEYEVFLHTDIAEKDKSSVYIHYANRKVIVMLAGEDDIEEIAVYGLNGKKVAELTRVGAPGGTLTLDSPMEGVFIVRVIAGNKVFTQKIIALL